MQVYVVHVDHPPKALEQLHDYSAPRLLLSPIGKNADREKNANQKKMPIKKKGLPANQTRIACQSKKECLPIKKGVPASGLPKISTAKKERWIACPSKKDCRSLALPATARATAQKKKVLPTN
jgi:hypothetical protein